MGEPREGQWASTPPPGAPEGSGALLYFDHAASAPRRPEVLDAVSAFSHGVVGNPSGSHRAARAARKALDDAREEVAELTGSMPGGVVFTAGGTESCNLAIFGVAADRLRRDRPARIAVSAVEHAAVLGPAGRLEGLLAGKSTTELVAVTSQGTIDLDALRAALVEGVDLVSVMTANNETGAIQPIPEVVEITRELCPDAVVHTDAVAAAPWLDLDDAARGADLVSLAAHKLGGPVGAGALCLRREVPLVPLFVGGGQERGRRAGTPDVAAAVGLATALRLTLSELSSSSVAASALRTRLLARLRDAVEGVHETIPAESGLPGTLHVLIEGVDNEELVVACDQLGLCLSAAVSFVSGATVASHVVLAMGVPEPLARGSLRISFGATTTEDEADRAAGIIATSIRRLRRG